MILHVDMDAFYASVEQRDNPELQGKPVIVGGSADKRGVVCAASYAARQFGVHSAMPTAKAARLCPQAVFLPVRMEHYASISEQIRRIFHRYTPLVEPLSLDEAFLDVSASRRLWGSAVSIARQIKQCIRDELHLVASVGVAPNKFLAKLASDLEKPDGLVVVPPDDIQGFLDPLPAGRLWGVGKRSEEVLSRLGVFTIRDVRMLPTEVLRSYFGEMGKQLAELARGEDFRKVTPDRRAKSISHETTFPEDVVDLHTLRSWVIALAEQVARRIRQHRFYATTVQVKVRYHDFSLTTRSKKLQPPTNATQPILELATQLLERRHREAPAPVRLVGVGVSGLAKELRRQSMLFDNESTSTGKLDAATDRIQEKFGRLSLRRASSMREAKESDEESPK